MNTEITLEDRLKLWQDVYTSKAEVGARKGKHLPSEKIYRMAESGGIEKCPKEDVAHLSLCPLCLKQWAGWRKAISAVADLEEGSVPEQEASSFMTYGLLKAAATDKPKGPISLRSVCGKFILNLLPQVDHPEKGMVTLEAIGPEDTSLEGRYVTVRDTKGLVFLEGTLRHGRLARLCEILSDIDLTTWTIMLGESVISDQ